MPIVPDDEDPASRKAARVRAASAAPAAAAGWTGVGVLCFVVCVGSWGRNGGREEASSVRGLTAPWLVKPKGQIVVGSSWHTAVVVIVAHRVLPLTGWQGDT
jgi:hypothetical protein